MDDRTIKTSVIRVPWRVNPTIYLCAECGGEIRDDRYVTTEDSLFCSLECADDKVVGPSKSSLGLIRKYD
jgi:hypothetical protein